MQNQRFAHRCLQDIRTPPPFSAIFAWTRGVFIQMKSGAPITIKIAAGIKMRMNFRAFHINNQSMSSVAIRQKTITGMDETFTEFAAL